MHTSLIENEAVLASEGLAHTYDHVGNLNKERGRTQDFHHAAHEAVVLYRELSAKYPGRFDLALARSLNNLGNALSDLGKNQETIEVTEEATAIFEELSSEGGINLLDFLRSLLNLSRRCHSAGWFERAESIAKESIFRFLPFFQSDPELYRDEMANMMATYREVVADNARFGDEYFVALVTEIKRSIRQTESDRAEIQVDAH